MLEVHITKGMRNGQKITFGGEADEAPGVIPGDIIFIVEEKVSHGHGRPTFFLPFLPSFLARLKSFFLLFLALFAGDF